MHSEILFISVELISEIFLWQEVISWNRFLRFVTLLMRADSSLERRAERPIMLVESCWRFSVILEKARPLSPDLMETTMALRAISSISSLSFLMWEMSVLIWLRF